MDRGGRHPAHDGSWGARANTSPIVAQAYLWAGYANRALGENMCEAVINGGPKEPRATFFQRAEGHFTKAIEIGTAAGGATGTNITTAAKAGRAAVRSHLGNWAGAVADAAGIATTFSYKMPYYNRGDADEYNRIAWAGFRQPYKTHTVWGTWYADYFKSTNDARVKYIDTGVVGDGKVTCCGAVPFYQQQKHALRESPITLSSGAEMRLIEAEDQLVKGNWQAAMTTINALRATYSVTPWNATNLNEAWAFLKRERGIHLYLEARRLGDMYRWKANNTPGALDPKETLWARLRISSPRICASPSRAARWTRIRTSGERGSLSGTPSGRRGFHPAGRFVPRG